VLIELYIYAMPCLLLRGFSFSVSEEHKCLNSELWHACAGPLVSLPTVGSRVLYFPQGHSEQVTLFSVNSKTLD
jgi:hypothetical protein